jgi:hypothetical protein
MSKFWQLNEDPDYDEDGVLIEEEWDDLDIPEDSYDPFDTVNS